MGQLKLGEQAAASTPESGSVVIYPKTDGLLYAKDDVGTESMVTTPSYLFQPRKNYLYNGRFFLWQRSTSINPTAAAFSVLGADRMGTYVSGSAGNFTWSRQPSGLAGSYYCGRLSRNATSSTTGRIYQVLETADCVHLGSRTVTFSFKARCSSGFTPASSQIQAYIISGTGSDQSGTSISTGSWTGQTNVVTTNVTLSTSWQTFSITGTFGSTVTQAAVALMATFVGTGSDYFETTDWQLEEGSTATDIEHRPIATELMMCRRYYETGNVLVRPYVANVVDFHWVYFSVQKRVAPTLSNSTLGSGLLTSINYYNAAAAGFEAGVQCTNTGHNGAYASIQYTASAEL